MNNLTMIWLVALALALAPFLEMPHLFQKINLAYHGWLIKSEDLFDLLFHAAGLVFALAASIKYFMSRGKKIN